VGKVKQQIIDRFIELGGNFIDTANFYTKSHSEKIIATAADKLAGVFAIRWAGSPLSLQIWQVWTGRVLSALPVLLLLLSRGEDCGLWRSPSVSLVLLQARLPPTMAPQTRTDRWRAARPVRSKRAIMASGQAGAQRGTSRCNDR
jgi:hypothetical protein